VRKSIGPKPNFFSFLLFFFFFFLGLQPWVFSSSPELKSQPCHVSIKLLTSVLSSSNQPRLRVSLLQFSFFSSSFSQLLLLIIIFILFCRQEKTVKFLGRGLGTCRLASWQRLIGRAGIDGDGSWVSTAAEKLCGVGRLATAGTHGGRSLMGQDGDVGWAADLIFWAEHGQTWSSDGGEQ
jgi:hypothetical protein